MCSGSGKRVLVQLLIQAFLPENVIKLNIILDT